MLRCKRIAQEPQDSALKGVTEEEADLPSNSVNSSNNRNPSQNHAQKIECQKANGNNKANQIINFILSINSFSHVSELEHFVKQIDGVDSVKGDCNSVRLEVMGKVDPYEVKEMVEHETKKKVELIFPSAEMKGDKNENKDNEAKSPKQTKTVYKNDIANKNHEERLTVFKTKLCCNSCNQKLCKSLEIKGLDVVSMDVDTDLVKVKGTTDLTDLRSYIKKELKKDVEIVVPTEVVVHVKKGDGTTKKKEKHVGDIDKKNEDAVATNKKNKDAVATNKKNKGTAVCEKYQATGKANEKVEGIAGVDEKNKSRAAFREPDKDKNVGIKYRKDRNKDGEKKSKIYNTIGSERHGDGGGNKEGELKNKAFDRAGGERGVGNREEYGNSTITLNPGMLYTHDHNAYGYWRKCPPCHPVNFSNDSLQIFSDENPHSCTIL